MVFDPLSAVVGLINGWRAVSKQAEASERWFRAGMQLVGTYTIAFSAVWGAATLSFLGLKPVLDALGVSAPVPEMTLSPLGALVAGFACGLLAGAGAYLRVWKTDPLLKTVTLWAPQAAEEMALKAPGTLTQGNPQKK